MKFKPDAEIESIRDHWKNSNIEMDQESIGVKSTVSNPKLISQIARKGVSDWSSSVMLKGIIDYLCCESVLELGTSLGINTAYLSKCSTVQEIITVEANFELVELAKETLKDAEIRIELITADITDAIVNLADRNKSFDFVLVDANHKYEATTNYFRQLKHLIHDESIIVFDDINWSPEMTRAWNEICEDEHVTLTLENFQMGIVFFNTKFKKKSYVLGF